MARIGRRSTAQRVAIRTVLQASRRPLTAGEILEQASASTPGLGIATVYRTVASMVESGWLQAVQLPGEPTRYEPADQAHHHYFHCTGCGKAFSVDGCPGELSELTPSGFEVERHEIVLYGSCRVCRSPATA
jgi:Fur family ferric uptake transcriptional regulator